MNGWPVMVSEDQGMFSSSVLPWQQATFAHFLAMHKSNRLPHALMLAGPDGCGKRVFAAALTSVLICKKVNVEASEVVPCGSCDGCSLLRAGSHGDIRWLAPEEGKRAIGVEAVREAIRFVQQTAGYGAYKVLVLAPAEAMTTAAANALLKTLEEPAGNSLICLVCHRPSDLPATVRSRCQVLAFPAPEFKEGLAWLQEEITDRNRAGLALELAEGRPIEALRLATTDALDELASIRQIIVGLLDQKHTAATASQLLSAANLDTILAVAVAVIETTLKEESSLNDPSRYRQLFCLRDELGQWASSVRRGVNLARDGLVAHLCNLLYTAAGPGV